MNSHSMLFAVWAVIVGTLLTTMALSSTLLKRLPLSTAMLYLGAGAVLGPAGWMLLSPDPIKYSVILEKMAEVALLISLFAAGLKLGVPLKDKRWYLPLRLAFISMTFTVALITLTMIFGFGLSLGAAILLAGILAPTDPVLASDVQVENGHDRDRLRFSLTGEGALNDGAALPFVLLGLGLLGLHDLGVGGWRWLVIDVAWGILGGLLLGAALGKLIGKLVVYLRSRHKESIGLDEFLLLGLIALSYGIAVLCRADGFLAVFAAGLALQHVKEQEPSTNKNEPMVLPVVLDSQEAQEAQEAIATHPEHASAYMMQAVRGFNEQLERIAEVAVVLVVGAMLAFTTLSLNAILFALLFFIVIRPIATSLALIGAKVSSDQRRLISWFGIRGIGSIYYLMYAINHPLPNSLVEFLIAITLTTVTASIVLHGISVTPLMNLYARRKSNKSA